MENTLRQFTAFTNDVIDGLNAVPYLNRNLRDRAVAMNGKKSEFNEKVNPMFLELLRKTRILSDRTHLEAELNKIKSAAIGRLFR